MRNVLTLLFALIGIGCFIAGDVLWLLRRRQDRPLDLRFTGGLIAAGIVIFFFAVLVLRPA
jgi:hypothetical protein